MKELWRGIVEDTLCRIVDMGDGADAYVECNTGAGWDPADDHITIETLTRAFLETREKLYEPAW